MDPWGEGPGVDQDQAGLFTHGGPGRGHRRRFLRHRRSQRRQDRRVPAGYRGDPFRARVHPNARLLVQQGWHRHVRGRAGSAPSAVRSPHDQGGQRGPAASVLQSHRTTRGDPGRLDL